MRFIEDLRSRASKARRKIVLPEGEDPRMIAAASILGEKEIARTILLGNEESIRSVAGHLNVTLPRQAQIVDPLRSQKSGDFARMFYQMRRHKGMTFEDAKRIVQTPLYFGNLLVHAGEADGCVAGSVNTSADVLRAGIQVVGVKEGSALVSSFFLMVLPDGRPVTYSDCGVVPSPDSDQLASIAIDAATSHRLLTGEEPRVALLSFSTKGSARHERVDLVQAALRIVQQHAPELAVDGELQFDAAFVPEVGIRKAPNSPVAGKANVFIFPNLDAGNIAYKITERIGGAAAFGPILQGIARPVNDLSRGCSAEDIVNVVAITALLAQG